MHAPRLRHARSATLVGLSAATLVLPLALAAGACSPQGAPATGELAAGGARQREIPRVRVGELERREMVQVLETTSKLESDREIVLYPRAAGVVTEVLAEEGDLTRKGDVLARLDHRDQALAVREAEVAEAEAINAAEQSELAVEEAAARIDSTTLAAEQAERDYERDRQLYEDSTTTSILSKSALEASRLARDNALAEKRQAEIAWRKAQLAEAAARTAVSRAKLALERAQLMLSYTEMTAPFDGVVAERTVRVGDTVGSSASAFVLTDIDNLRAVFYRPQEELELFTRPRDADLDDRLRFTATAEAYPGKSFSGYVERISPTVDGDSGQFRVTARLERPAEPDRTPLLPGMLVRMILVTDRHPEALVVPKRSLRREGERRYVLAVADDETVRRVDVREGFSDEEWVEVVPATDDATLTAGTPIVIVGSRDLAHGDLVAIDAEQGAAGGDVARDGATEPATDDASEGAAETAAEPSGATDEG